MSPDKTVILCGAIAANYFEVVVDRVRRLNSGKQEILSMRAFLQVLALVMALAILGAGTVGAQNEAVEAIKAVNQQFQDYVAEGNVDAIAMLYTEDGMFMQPNANPFVGHEAIKEAIAGMIATGVGAVRLTSDELQVFGDTAHEVGRYVLETADGDHIDHGKYICIWKRINGEWRLHRDIFNSNMAPS